MRSAKKLKYPTRPTKGKIKAQLSGHTFNEVGEDCLMFVAADVNKLPLATVDAFDLSAILNNYLATVLQMNVREFKAAFTAILLLQTDLMSVLGKLSDVDTMKAMCCRFEEKLVS